MAQTLRQQARSRVYEGAAARKRAWAEREAELSAAAVDVVAAITARDRAESAAADAIGRMLKQRVSLTEIGERCGLPLKEVTRLKRAGTDQDDGRPSGDVASEAPATSSGPTLYRPASAQVVRS